jgi:hypothetical protein
MTKTNFIVWIKIIKLNILRPTGNCRNSIAYLSITGNGNYVLSSNQFKSDIHERVEFSVSGIVCSRMPWPFFWSDWRYVHLRHTLWFILPAVPLVSNQLMHTAIHLYHPYRYIYPGCWSATHASLYDKMRLVSNTILRCCSNVMHTAMTNLCGMLKNVNIIIIGRSCDLVVRVLRYRSGVPGSIPGTIRFSEK